MNRPLATSAIALILGAGPALADVSPAEVWQNLRGSYEEMGYNVTVGSEDASDDVLTINELTLTVDEKDAPVMTLVVPQIVLTAVGDGTVQSVVEGQMTLETSVTPTEEDKALGQEQVGFNMTLDAPENVTISSGTADAMTHSFTMPTVTMSGSAKESENEIPLTATLTGVTGSQTINSADDGSSTQTYDARADMMELLVTASGPSLSETDDAAQTPDTPDTTEIDTFEAKFTIADLAAKGKGTNPAGDLSFGDNPSKALQAGFDADGTMTMGAMTGSFSASSLDMEGERSDTNGEFTAASGTLAVALSADGLSYEGGTTDMVTKLVSSDIPFPISYAVAENTFRLSVPVIASQKDQPFALTYVLNELTLDDAIWQAMDPEAALPRTPANLTIDLEGQTLLTENYLDPEFADAAPKGDDIAPEMPLQPRSLTIKEVTLDAVGATIDLSGALTFGKDPTQPTGTINGTFGGINGLLDKLVAMGVVPQEQLMGPRMMMAMFARPVEGSKDQLETEIEFREGGSIFANGQQIQ